jgi:putative membrane protein
MALLRYRFLQRLEKRLSETETREKRGVLATRGTGVPAIRGAIGGTLMGLANLVPGISGGTMLLAAGVYPSFISAIAEVTTLRFRPRSLVLLGTIVTTAALGILLLAGTIKALVEDHRWIMYSLFIGLTLGGVPLVWRMARPASPSLALGAAGAFAAMLAMAFSSVGAPGGAAASYLLVFLSGLAAASAMILPGVSGGYLLLLLGQYEPILGTIDQLKQGLLGNATGGVGPDFALILDAMHVVIPLGLGVVAGVVGVSNLLRWLLLRFEKPTLGVLLGLLLGAVVGLWPFQQARQPEPGEVVKGRVVTADNAASFSSEDWPLHSFEPSAKQVGASLGLILLGLGTTALIGRLGGEAPEGTPPDHP